MKKKFYSLRTDKKEKAVLDKDKSFVARLPYPLTIHALVDIVERMGVEYEGRYCPA